MNLTEQKIEEKIKEILDNSDTEIFVLGCAGMADFAVKMKKKKFEMYQVGTSIKTKKIYLDGKITSLNKGYKHF